MKLLGESGLLALTQTFGASGLYESFQKGDEGQRAPTLEETPGNPVPRCNSTGGNMDAFSSPSFLRFFGSIQVEMPANTETEDSLELIWHSFGISYFLNIQLLILQILRQNKGMQKPSNIHRTQCLAPQCYQTTHIISMGTSCRPGPLSQVGHSTRASCATESPALLDECLIALDHI